MKKITLFLCLCLIIIAFSYNMRVEAGFVFNPLPWEVVFEDDNRIFYMTSRQLTDWERSRMDASEERMQIRTGLYYIGEPRINIYYADINAHPSSVVFSRCGMYFATISWTADNFHGENLGGGVVNFFNNGVLIRSYALNDLLRNPRTMVHTSAGDSWTRGLPDWRSWPDNSAAILNTNEFTLMTTDYRIIVFDITTGRIVIRWLHNAILFPLIALISIVLLVAILRGKIRAFSKRRTSPEETYGD